MREGFTRRRLSIAGTLVLFLCAPGTAKIHVNDPRPQLVEYCDLVKNPETYDGKEVRLRATYRYGFEWQELFCLACREIGKTWLEFDEELSAKMTARLRKFPKDQGTINGVFSGVFHSSKGPWGQGEYRFQLLVREITSPEVVSRSGWAPDHLRPNERKKVCGAAH
jgi:hypothetical protein